MKIKKFIAGLSLVLGVGVIFSSPILSIMNITLIPWQVGLLVGVGACLSVLGIAILAKKAKG